MRDPVFPGRAEPELSACDQGDSASCNDVAEELWEQQAYSEARDWFRVSCGRLDDMVESGQRMVELGGKVEAAQQVVNAAARGVRVEPQTSSAALETIQDMKPIGDEFKARVEGCIRVGDTHHMEDNHTAALPYFDSVCKLRAIQSKAEPLVQGLGLLVTSACDASQYSRHVAAAGTDSRAEVVKALSPGAASPAPVATFQPAQALGAVQQPSQQMPASCPDFGRSCETDPTVLHWKQQCEPNPANHPLCYCAAAAAFDCLIDSGCYAEAGARRPDGQPSDNKLATLQQGLEQSTAGAQELGAWCP